MVIGGVGGSFGITKLDHKFGVGHFSNILMGKYGSTLSTKLSDEYGGTSI